MNIEVGIDFGTSNIQVGVMSDGPPQCVVGSGGGCPAIVALGPQGPVVGSQAALRAQSEPGVAVTWWKWLLGRQASSVEARRIAAVAGLKLALGDAGEACLVAGGTVCSPVDLAGYALRHVVDAAARATGDTPADVVIGVPAAFDTDQRAALVLGARKVRITLDRMVRETTAVALAELDRGFHGLVAVVDAGVARSEVALFDVSADTLEVLGRRSEMYLGTHELDGRLCGWLRTEIERTTRQNLADDPLVAAMLLHAVSGARRAAGALGGAPLVVPAPFLEGVDGRGLDTSWEIPRARVGSLAEEVIDRLAALCAQCIADAGVAPEEVTRVIVTGGLGRLAESRDRLATVWRRPCTMAPEASVARGAALYGAALRGTIPLRMLHEEPVPEGPPQRMEAMHTVRAPASGAPTPTTGPTPPGESVRAPWGSHAPQREYASSIPPSPTAARPAAVIPREGRFKGVLSAADLAALPLNRAATPQDVALPALPVVLLYFGSLKDLTGVLTLRQGTDTAPVQLFRGTPTMGTAERARAHKGFGWTEGEYSFAPSTDISPSATRRREPMPGFILAGLRPALRAMIDTEVAAALAGRVEQSPVIPPDRLARVERLGLTENEQRLVAHQFDGTRGLAKMFDGNPLGRQTLARLVLVLDTFGAIEWRVPNAPVEEAPTVVLARRLERMRDMDHFQVIGVHWSVNLAEITAAYEKFKAEYAPGTVLARAAPDECRALLARGAEAYAVLSSETARLKHRKEVHPEIDADLLAPLLASRANALAMKGEMDEARDMQRLLGEVSPREALVLRDQLAMPGLPRRTGAPPKAGR